MDQIWFQLEILRDVASELSVVLSSLFQQFYESGILPHAWKAANIYAIFKKGSKADPKNYRKVSLTSLTPKVVEHIVSCHISLSISVVFGGDMRYRYFLWNG